MNENTAFIDASHIYGGDPRTVRELRVGALIKTTTFGRLIFPPQVIPFTVSPFPPIFHGYFQAGTDNIMTGDNRANLFIGLAALHTIFLRLHNRIATQFFSLNRHWDEERVFQETRY